jgi:exonuclease SbcD
MRFLHTSDWHLGRVFHGLKMVEEQEYVLEQVLNAATLEKVEAILIAGDIYDRAVPPTDAIALLDKTLTKIIKELKIPVILIAGNHDNPERLGFSSNLLAEEGLYIYGPATKEIKPVILKDQYGSVYFSPLTYLEPLQARILSEDPTIKTHEAALKWQVEMALKNIPKDARKVCLAHVFLTGATPTPESERTLSIGGSSTVSIDCFKDFNYTALGHLHGCQSGDATVRYSGSLLKYSFNEVNQQKGFHIVDLDEKGNVSVQTIPIKANHELARLEGSFLDLINNPKDELKDSFLQVTLLDKTPILDAKYRLEEIYPNILHLEYKEISNGKVELDEKKAQLQLGPEELFANFFEQVNGRNLNEAETKLLEETINELITSERNK